MNELQAFEKHLRENEKSPATIEKYLRDARAFLRCCKVQLFVNHSE